VTVDFDPDFDRYDAYAERYAHSAPDRAARRERKTQREHKRPLADARMTGGGSAHADFARLEDAAGERATTYRPARHEAIWLGESLQAFYEQDLVSDVQAIIKGGKEANVYRCQAGPGLRGASLVAAKVYRPRMFRNLRNDHLYRQGRETIKSDGKVVEARDVRMLRAIGKKSRFGRQVAHTSWLMHEHTTLQALFAAGIHVPRPLAAADNALLMAYIGDAHQAAPTLHECQLERAEAAELFGRILEDVRRMLALEMIHGDLSAYNILVHQGEFWLIDFPQITHSRRNDHALAIFARDVRRVCEYFARAGVPSDPDAIISEMWQAHVPSASPREIEADLSRLTDTD
jgi:RIO kinase 1